MYKPADTSAFYDAYGLIEWNRLESTAYGRLQFLMHTELIACYCKPGYRVLDIGSGPGRFSIELARLGARVTVADISPRQLEIARQKIAEAGFGASIDAYVQADVADLSQFADESFDLTLCFGGALSYVCERRHEAAKELVRVTKTGGVIIVGVMNRLGNLVNSIKGGLWVKTFQQNGPMLAEAARLLETGDLTGVRSRIGREHPPMHLYTAAELQALLPGCEMSEIAGSNIVAFEGSETLEQLAQEPAVWANIVNLERMLNRQTGLVETGSHLMLVAHRL